MIPKPFSEMGPMERETYLKALARRVYKARAQIDAGRRDFAVVNHAPDDAFTGYRAQCQTLELGGLNGVDVMYQWDQIFSEIQTLLKTVNTISGQTVDEARRRLIMELQGSADEAKEESGPGSDRG